MLVIRAITEPTGGRSMVVEVLEVDPAGQDRVLLVTSSSRLATRAVRDWLEVQDPARHATRPLDTGTTRVTRVKSTERTTGG